jgi:putative membrane protein
MRGRKGAVIAAAVCTAIGAMAGMPAAGAHGTNHHKSHHQRLNSQDREFLKSTSEGARFEVAAGMTATTHAARDDVKAFGQRMIDDHSREAKDVEALAAKLHVRVPKEPSDEQQKIVQLFAQFSGKAFDCMYIADEWTDHENDINEAKLELAEGKNGQVRAFARHWLKVYKQHDEMASDILLSLDDCH